MGEGWTWPGTEGLDVSGPPPLPSSPPSVPPAPPPPPAPPASTGGSSEGPGGDGAPTWVWVVSAVLFVSLVAGVTWFLVAGRDDGAKVTVELEPRAEPGAGAFTSSFVTVDDGTVDGFSTVDDRPSGDRGGRFAIAQVLGDRAGLYGSVDGEPCDRHALADALVGDGDVAAAFAGVLGVAPSDVEAVVVGLAPVVLGRDTVVTNHRYRDGRAEPFQAVLQAGTVVLVDAVGVPRVRCACGNPLTSPQVEGRSAVVRGERWQGYSDRRVSQVVPAGVVLTSISTVDVRTAAPRAVPVADAMGADGASGGSTTTGSEPVGDARAAAELLVSDGSGVHVVSADGVGRTTVIDHPVAAVFDDGAGGLIYQERRPGSTAGDRSEYERPPEDPASAAVMHLPAGSAEPVPLVEAAGGSWPVLVSVFVDGGLRRVAFASLSGSAGNASGDLRVRDLDSGAEAVLVENAFLVTDGVALSEATASAGGGRIFAVTYSTDHVLWNVTSQDLGPIDVECGLAIGREGCPLEGVADGEARVVSVSDGVLEVHDVVSARLLFSVDLPAGTPPPGEQVDAVGSRAVVSRSDGSTDAVLVDLTARSATPLAVRGSVRFLRSPLSLPAPGEGEATDPPPSDGAAGSVPATGDGLAGVAVGGPAAGLVEELVGALGQPDDDPGFAPEPCDTGGEVRELRWGALRVSITRRGASGDGELSAWLVTFADGAVPAGLAVEHGVGPDWTWDDVEALGARWDEFSGTWELAGLQGELAGLSGRTPDGPEPVAAVGAGATGLRGC